MEWAEQKLYRFNVINRQFSSKCNNANVVNYDCKMFVRLCTVLSVQL